MQLHDRRSGTRVDRRVAVVVPGCQWKHGSSDGVFSRRPDRTAPTRGDDAPSGPAARRPGGTRRAAPVDRSVQDDVERNAVGAAPVEILDRPQRLIETLAILFEAPLAGSPRESHPSSAAPRCRGRWRLRCALRGGARRPRRRRTRSPSRRRRRRRRCSRSRSRARSPTRRSRTTRPAGAAGTGRSAAPARAARRRSRRSCRPRAPRSSRR